MPISTSQIAICIGSDASLINRMIRTGELKAEREKNGKYNIGKEDLADFFIAHPAFWIRFLKTPHQKRYFVFHDIMVKEVRQKAGKSGPLYYKSDDLSKLIGITCSQIARLERNGVLRYISNSRSHYAEEDSVINILKHNKRYLNNLVNLEADDRWIAYLRDHLINLLEEE